MSSLPKRIGRFRVREVIGAGAFATVYRATDEQLGMEVALKVLAENRSLVPEVRERFIEEGRRLRRVRSPHVIAVYDLGDTDRAQPYLVLDLADRGDLSQRVTDLRRQGWQPQRPDVLAVVRALSEALGVLHAHGLVHRDLAPRNLLLRSTGTTQNEGADSPGSPRLIAADEELVLSDLGLSKDLAAASGFTVAAGTTGFAPPEQLRSGLVDQRSDVWAASALVVWLILGHAPGDEADPWQDGCRRAGWPAPVIAALTRALADSPEQRHGTIGEWRSDLEPALAEPLDAGATLAFGGGTLVRTAAGDGVSPHDPTPSGPRPLSTPKVAPAEPRTGTAFLGRARLWVTWPAVAALGLGVAVGIGGSALWPSDGPSVTTTTLDNGDERTRVEQHGITVTIEGPTSATSDNPVTLVAEVDGTDTWQWVAPDGQVYLNEPELRLHPETTGQTTARLLAFDDESQILEATRELRITADD